MKHSKPVRLETLRSDPDESYRGASPTVIGVSGQGCPSYSYRDFERSTA